MRFKLEPWQDTVLETESMLLKLVTKLAEKGILVDKDIEDIMELGK